MTGVKDLSSLEYYLSLSGLLRRLDSKSLDATLLAPEDDAFTVFEASEMRLTKALTTKPWILHLISFLALHLTEEQYYIGDFENGSQLEMLNGDFVDISMLWSYFHY